MAEGLDSSADIRAHYGEPSVRAIEKQMAALDHFTRRFIALSPFLVIASSDATGRGDASPRGDHPGFVHVLDDRMLAIPDRTGNRRVDTMLNIAENPQIGLLFLVPGFAETLRVNGRARLTTDAQLLELLSARGRAPESVLLVAIEEVYFQCGKAIVRSDLWNPDCRVDRASFPSLAQIIAAQAPGVDQAVMERQIEEAYAAVAPER